MEANNALQPASRPKIILAEDDDAVRRSLQLVLQARGYDVRAYASSNNLAADAAAMNAACLIADYRMPNLDGLEMLRLLRANGWRGPAVLITGFSSHDLVRQARNAGYSEIMEKPLREGVLADVVTRLVNIWSNQTGSRPNGS